MNVSQATLVGAGVRVCRIEEIPLGLGHAFQVRERILAIFRTREGKVFATDNRCPHRGGPLADGLLAGEMVVCPLHLFKFHLATGDCDQAHVCEVETFPAEVRDGWVFVDTAARQEACARP